MFFQEFPNYQNTFEENLSGPWLEKSTKRYFEALNRNIQKLLDSLVSFLHQEKRSYYNDVAIS